MPSQGAGTGGRRAPSGSIARPEAWCCPQTLEWAGRQGSCNTGWAAGGHGNPAPLPCGGVGWLEGAMLAAAGPGQKCLQCTHRRVEGLPVAGST